MKKVKSTYYKVKKSAAFTHLTTGGIIHVSASMHLTDGSGQTIYYERQLLIQPDPSAGPFAARGDSGAVVMSEDNYVVGLLVGGEDIPPLYLATPIGEVLNSLKHKMSAPSLNFIVYR